jgi:peptidoglycan hydrolase CwlO-like protein
MFQEDTAPTQFEHTTGTPRWIGFSIAALVTALGVVTYLGYRASTQVGQELASQNAALTAKLGEANARIATLQSQLEATGRKVGLTQKDLASAKTRAEEIRREQEAANQQLGQQLTTQIGEVQKTSEEKIGTVATNLDTTNKNLEATKTDIGNTLKSMKGDEGVMSGLIAHNHDDLEALRQRGERNYFEFSIVKSKAAQRVGPIQVLLRSADPKRSKYTIRVTADDRVVEKSDKTAGEPVQFYVKGTRNLPYEIVVFDVAKDKIVGYLSTPKVAN